MRLPKLTDLDADQLDVFEAPFSGSTLIVGPPGSGKTVLAFFRAAALQKLGRHCRIVMFNNVLSRYADRSSVPEIGTLNRTDTLHSWLKDWWIRGTGKHLPLLPASTDSSFRSPDFQAMMNAAAALGPRDRLDWGHLIIDEGQDFPRGLYDLFRFCKTISLSHLPADAMPAMTILADENQRITEENSTIEDIRMAAAVDRTYFLRSNYRNTRQVAEFARQFYVGLESGTTDLPEREGETPRIVRSESMDESVNMIARYVQRHDDQEVGVLVPRQEQCRRYYDKLKNRLRDCTKVRVQAYISGEEKLRAERLKFDRKGTVSVFCYGSGKGLEFDAVFLPELQTIHRDAGREEVTKMTLYVMCTRARQSLTLLYEGDLDFSDIGVGRWLPARDSSLAKWE